MSSNRNSVNISFGNNVTTKLTRAEALQRRKDEKRLDAFVKAMMELKFMAVALDRGENPLKVIKAQMANIGGHEETKSQVQRLFNETNLRNTNDFLRLFDSHRNRFESKLRKKYPPIPGNGTSTSDRTKRDFWQ